MEDKKVEQKPEETKPVEKAHDNKQENAGERFEPKIYKICLTGGPCAGKTTASSLLKERLQDRFILYFLPELAATTVQSGVVIIPSEFTPDTHKVFTEGIMKMQMEMEDYFKKIASIQKKDVIIVCDRGCIDNLAYCSPENKERILKETGWTLEKIRDERYDAVIHLVTAADGAEKFYTLENNTARTETPEVARWIDKKTQSVWNGHPNMTIISNTEVKSFQHKMDEVYKCICKVLDVPDHPSFIKKYLLEGVFDPKNIPAGTEYETFIEYITFLPNSKSDEEFWAKKRVSKQTKGETYSYTRRKFAKNASEQLELRRTIDHRQYEDYMKVADKGKKAVVKEIIVFIYENQTCHIETFEIDGKKFSVLRCFVVDLQKVNIPPFVKVIEDISENPKYFTANLATNPSDAVADAHEKKAI